MAKLTKDLKQRIVIAVTSEKYGKELIDAIEGAEDILTGNTAPPNSLGDNENLYVNLITGDLHVKYNDAWELKARGGDMGVQAAFEYIEQPVGIKAPLSFLFQLMTPLEPLPQLLLVPASVL